MPAVSSPHTAVSNTPARHLERPATHTHTQHTKREREKSPPPPPTPPPPCINDEWHLCVCVCVCACVCCVCVCVSGWADLEAALVRDGLLRVDRERDRLADLVQPSARLSLH